MTREDHVATCRAEAMWFLPRDPERAVAVMARSLMGHPETNTKETVMLCMAGLVAARRGSEAVRRWLVDFK